MARLSSLLDPMGLGAFAGLAGEDDWWCRPPEQIEADFAKASHVTDCELAALLAHYGRSYRIKGRPCDNYMIPPDAIEKFRQRNPNGLVACGGNAGGAVSAAGGAISSLFSSSPAGGGGVFGSVPSWVWYVTGAMVLGGIVLSRRGR